MSINPLGRDFLQNALFLAHAAKACYEGNPANDKGLRPFGFDEMVSFAPDDGRPFPKALAAGRTGESARGYIGANENAIVVAFRGTDDVTDWLINLKVMQIEDHGALVHRGFCHALAAVWPRIEAKLQSLLDRRPRKIWMTGHSLGGALATLAALRIGRMGIGPFETHTFGQPRVGDRVLAAQIPSPFYRFAYYADPVCMAPFSVPRTMRYKHGGTLKQIDAAGQIVGKDSHVLTRTLSKILSATQVAGDFLNNDLKSFLTRRINDHSMSNYIEKIESHLLRLGSFPENQTMGATKREG